MWWVLDVLPGFQQVLAVLGGLGRFLLGLGRSWCVLAGLNWSKWVWGGLVGPWQVSPNVGGSSRISAGLAIIQGHRQVSTDLRGFF